MRGFMVAFWKNGFAECGTKGERSSASRVTRFDLLFRNPVIGSLILIGQNSALVVESRLSGF
jgi:hypothetical protein